MNYGLIGCGRIATNHIKAALNNDLDIVAVCDVLSERMEELLAEYQFREKPIKRYTDYKLMLREEKLDIVAIATESGLHADIAIDCIAAGVNLIVEKPIALSIQDADRIISAAEETGVKVCACHQNRFNEAVQHIRDALEGGRFGKLSHGTVHVRWNRGKSYYDQAKWRGTWENDGGALMNQSIHGIDLLRWMMGEEIDEVFAFTQNRFHDYFEAEDIGVAVVRFKNGALGTIEGTTNVFPQNLEESLYIFGQQGTVKAAGKSVNTIELWNFADKRAADDDFSSGFSEQTDNVYGNGHMPLYKDMIEAVKTDRQPYVDAHDGKKAVELVLAIYKSQKTGQPVKFPLENFSSIDMR